MAPKHALPDLCAAFNIASLKALGWHTASNLESHKNASQTVQTSRAAKTCVALHVHIVTPRIRNLTLCEGLLSAEMRALRNSHVPQNVPYDN